MAKKVNTNLGNAVTPISPNVKKEELYLDTEKATPIEQDMIKQFEAVQTSLTNINTYLKKAVSQQQVRGSYATAFKAWAKKSKSQATNANTAVSDLKAKFEADVKDYTIKLLSDRIAALEAKINSMRI